MQFDRRLSQFRVNMLVNKWWKVLALAGPPALCVFVGLGVLVMPQTMAATLCVWTSPNLAQGRRSSANHPAYFSRSGNGVEAAGRHYSLFALRGHDQSGMKWVAELLGLHQEVAVAEEYVTNPRFYDSKEAIIGSVGIFPHAVEEGAKDMYARTVLEATWVHAAPGKLVGYPGHLLPTVRWLGERAQTSVAHQYIPDMPVIHVVRDVRDVIVSTISSFLASCSAGRSCWLYNELQGLRTHLQAKVMHYRSEPDTLKQHPQLLLNSPRDEELVSYFARKWQEQVDRDKSLNRFALRVHTVSYEDLFTNSEKEAAALYRFLGLDPSQAAKVPAEWSGKVQPAIPEAGGWKRYATPYFVRAVCATAQNGLQYYSYEMDRRWCADSGTMLPPSDPSIAQPVAPMAQSFDPDQERVGLPPPIVQPIVPPVPVQNVLPMDQGLNAAGGQAPFIPEDAPDTEEDLPDPLMDIEVRCLCPLGDDPPVPLPLRDVTLALGAYNYRDTEMKPESKYAGKELDLMDFGALNLVAAPMWRHLETDATAARDVDRFERLYINVRGPLHTLADLAPEEGMTARELDHVWDNMKIVDNKPVAIVGLQLGRVYLSLQGRNVRDVATGKQIDMTANVVLLNDRQIGFLKMLESRASGLIGVNGAFTEEVLKLHGFTKFKDMGSPGIFLNTNPMLGREMGKKYAGLKAKMAHAFRTAISLPSWWAPVTMQMLLTMLVKFPDSLIVLNRGASNKTVAKIQETMPQFPIKSSSIKLVGDIQEWHNTIASVDLVFTPDIITSMVALWAETPVVTVVMDMQVKEMVESMRMAHVDIFSRNLRAGQAVRTALEAAAAFDGEAFDARRAELAALYGEVFSKAGMRFNPPVKDLR